MATEKDFITVELSPEEWGIAHQEVMDQIAECEEKNRKNARQLIATPEESHRISTAIMSEFAVAKGTNRIRHKRTFKERMKADVGEDIAVKTISKLHSPITNKPMSLLIPKYHLKEDQKYVVVLWDYTSTRFDMIGWMEGSEVPKRASYHNGGNPNRKPAYFLAWTELHPMSTLPKEE